MKRDEKNMYYSCPNCSSKKKPKLVNYFPPIAAKCLDCGHMNLEIKFIKEEEKRPPISLNFSQ
jgi:uncharacterized Zn finger protein